MYEWNKLISSIDNSINVKSVSKRYAFTQLKPYLATKNLLIGTGIGIGSVWLVNHFSGRDDVHNSIEGLKHGGIAEQKRKEMTDFGSGYDPIRALAKTMGKTFEELVGSKGFREALTGGKTVKELASGAFGKAELMEGMFEGQAFKFVRKTQHEFEKSVDIIYKNSVARDKNITREMATEFVQKNWGFQKEAEAMRELGLTETVPSAYMESGKELFMEAMPGKSISEVFKSGGELPQEAQQAIYRTIDEAAQKKIMNMDIHYGNLLYDPESQRMSWIDWGASTLQTPTSPGAIKSIMGKKVTPYISSSPAKSIPKVKELSAVAVKSRVAEGIASTKLKQNAEQATAAVERAFSKASVGRESLGLMDTAIPEIKPRTSLGFEKTILPGIEDVTPVRSVPQMSKIGMGGGTAVVPLAELPMLNRQVVSNKSAVNIIDPAIQAKRSQIATVLGKEDKIAPAMTGTIDAFGGTEAAASRHIHSDFGSGYRKMLSSSSHELSRYVISPGRAKKKLVQSSGQLKKDQKQLWHCANYGGRYHTRYKSGSVIS